MDEQGDFDGDRCQGCFLVNHRERCSIIHALEHVARAAEVMRWTDMADSLGALIAEAQQGGLDAYERIETFVYSRN